MFANVSCDVPYDTSVLCLPVYRATFRMTYAEMTAPTGEWKTVMAGVLLALSFTGWVLIWMKMYGT